MYQKIQEFINRKKITILAISVMLVAFVSIFLVYASSRSLSYDELEWTINFMDNGFLNMLEQLSTGLYNLPLFYIIAYQGVVCKFFLSFSKKILTYL